MQSLPSPVSADFRDEDLRDALESANLPSLLAALAHLTGEDRWVSPPWQPTPPPDLGDHDSAGFDDETRAAVLAASFDTLRAWRDGELTPAPTPSPERLVRLLSATVGDRLPEDYGRLLGEELGAYPRASVPSRPDPDREVSVVIVGAGASGLCLAVRLAEAGIPYVVLEKGHDVGGTWNDNTYPGCGVDTPSHLYSLSFAPNPQWSRYFARRGELARYWRDLADEHGVRSKIRFGTEVTGATWDDDAAEWVTTLSTGEEIRSTALVSAVGLLNVPSIPAIAGLDSFEGPCLHTARWDADLDLTGQRVAVIGTGASAMQLVPAASKVAAEVRVFQRSPQWAMPHPLQPREVPEAVHFLNRHVPWYQGWYRLRLFWRMGDKLHGLLQIDPDFAHPDRAINRGNDGLRRLLTGFVQASLKDRPDLLEKSLPTYPPYGKRLLVDHGWYRTLLKDNVELVTDGISEVTPKGVRTADGVEHEADVVVLATGFNAVKVLETLDIRGRDGRALHELWGSDDGRAHLGISVPGFPNFFCLYGPNTNTGHGGTVIAGTEIQVQHVTALLSTLVDERLASVEVRQEAFDRYDAELGEALDRTIWNHRGMDTYYRNSKGRIVTNSPWQYIEYWRRTHEPVLADFHLRAVDERAEVTA